MEQKAHLTLFGFPIRFEPFFWISAVLLGSRLSFQFIIYWVLILTVSILVHELGHAFAYRHYGSPARIVLHGLGGAAIGRAQPPRQAIVVSAAGSLTQMALLGFPSYFLRNTIGIDWGFDLWWILGTLAWFNIFWAIVNLLPMWPLDGGHILENVIILRTGQPNMRLVHMTSMVTVVVAVYVSFQLGYPMSWFLPLLILGLNGWRLYKPESAPISIYASFNPAWDGDVSGGSRAPTATKPKTKRRRRKRSDPQVVAPLVLSDADTLAAAYDSLEAGDKRSARGRVRDLAAKTSDRSVSTAAREILAWSWLRDGEATRAKQQLDASMNHSDTLEAGLIFGGGNYAEGVRKIAAAMAIEENDRIVFQGSALVCEKGFGTKLADALLERTDGFGAAMQLHGVMIAVGARDDAAQLMTRLMG